MLHVLCASYDESPITVCDSEESAYFLNIGIKAYAIQGSMGATIWHKGTTHSS